MTEEQNKLAEGIERHLAPDAIYSRWRPSMDDMRLIVAALRSPARVRLSDFVNDADIGGADSPHIVVEKLQAAIDRAREPATEAVLEDEYDQKSVDIIKNLAMLVRRLCYKHPNDKLTDQAMAYLRGEKLEGSILRTALKGKGASQGDEALRKAIESAPPGDFVKANAPEPSGEFVMVPREPTPAMLDALEQGPALLRDSESWQDYQRRQWAMVLAAASPDEQKG